MRLLFTALAFSLILLSGTASSEGVYVRLSADQIHLGLGNNYLAKVYIRNPEPTPKTITAVLGGSYPSSLARFWVESGASFAPDRRQLSVQLNPYEERMFSLEILSTMPKDGGYSVNVLANPAPVGASDSDSMKVFIDYVPSYPGLDSLSLGIMIAASGLAFWSLRKKGFQSFSGKKVLPAVFAGLFLTFLASPASAAIYTCSDCYGCNNVISGVSPGDIVQLTSDIWDWQDSCISTQWVNDFTFDCMGHTIDGMNALDSHGMDITSFTSGVTVRNCNIQEFYKCISFEGSSNNNYVTRTRVENCGHSSIYMWDSDYNTFSFITAQSDKTVWLSYSDNNVIRDSRIYGSTEVGLWLYYSSENNITNVTITGNTEGLVIFGNSHYNVINNSRIVDNPYGIKILSDDPFYPSDNLIYNNYFNNDINFDIDSINYENLWNVASRAGTNIVGGPRIGGNYWSGPNLAGYSDTCTDANLDGFCDQPYALFGMNTDWLPLTTPPSDTTPPDIWFVNPTPTNNTVLSRNYIEVNVSLSEDAGTCLLNWYNGASWTNFSMSNNGRSCYRNMTGLSNGLYRFRVYASDVAGNWNRTIGIRQNTVSYTPPDVTPPDIWFVNPTPPNNTVVTGNYIEVNVSLSESPNTCLLNWYNGAWVNYTMTKAGRSCYLNMTGLSNQDYQFRVYGNDTAGNMNVSYMRQNTVLYVPTVASPISFSVDEIFLSMGESFIVKTYVTNPTDSFKVINVSLAEDYPGDLAEFSVQYDAIFTPDRRNFSVPLNPSQEKIFHMTILSPSSPPGSPGYYTITANAESQSYGPFSESIRVYVNYRPSFTGIEAMGVIGILAFAVALFWVRSRPIPGPNKTRPKKKPHKKPKK